MFKRIMVAVAFGLMAIAAQAEATFDQIQGLIEQRQYAAAAQGLEVIIQNHPKSAKAFYAMAQAQAGLGNQEKAQKALNIATGLNPTLDFAPASSVASLKQAITPQVAKIESIEESHFWRNAVLVLFVFAVGGIIYTVYRKNKEADEKYEAEIKAIEEKARAERDAELAERIAKLDAERKREHMEMLAKQDAERKAELAAEEALKAHKNYGHERFDPANPDKLKSVKQFKEEQAAAELREAQARADAAETAARQAQLRSTYNVSTPAPAPTTTVVHTNSGSNDMLTGVLIGNMLSNSGHHHDTERTVIRETVREVPIPSRDSSWDDTPSRPSSRSSSWDDDSSSSSKSSSSWSSSSSDSSSSWSSDSSSSSDSGASWD